MRNFGVSQTRSLALLGSLARSLALLGLALATAVVGGITLAFLIPGIGLGLVFLVPWPLATGRRFTNAVRRISGKWCGVPILIPYKPEPPPPLRRSDGMYEQDGSLHKHAWWPRLSERLEWVTSDRATGKDLLWMLTHPIVGGVLAGLPVALIGAGVWGAVLQSLWWLLAIPLGVLDAPAMNRAYGRWCHFLLAPTRANRMARIDARKKWIGEHVLAEARLLALGATGVLSALTAVVMLLATILTYGIGFVFAMPPAVDLARRLAGARREMARRWSGVVIDTPYRPAVPPEREPDGRYRFGKQLYRTEAWAVWMERLHRYMKDPATWRDFAWTAADPFCGAVFALIPCALTFGSMVVLFGPTIGSIFDGTFGWLSVARMVLALVLIPTGLAIAPWVLHGHGQWTAGLLAPTENARLNLRIEELTEARSDAAADSAAELRRIERDLHDGAQARLVAIGMTLTAIEQLIATDPAAARKLAAQGRETSATALQELRALVRGIHPPVLSERGLGSAVQALALDCPLPVDVEVRVPGRFTAPIESAAYFAVAEALANAVRHAQATRVSVALAWSDGALHMAVSDNGIGGADLNAGTGLAGIRRRLGTFDGIVQIDSRADRGTTVTMELPCALSSPKTSSS